jgi:hypothetical protein
MMGVNAANIQKNHPKVRNLNLSVFVLFRKSIEIPNPIALTEIKIIKFNNTRSFIFGIKPLLKITHYRSNFKL